MSDIQSSEFESSDQRRSKSIRAQARELGRVRIRQTRLLFTIPALMFSFTLLIGLIIRLNLMGIATELPDPEVRNEINYLANQILIWMIGGAVAVLMVGFVLAREIIKPVKNILGTMKKVAEGDYTQRAAASSFGEIDTLGTAFNDMVSQLHTVFTRRDRQIREAAAGSVLTVDGYGKVLAADSSFSEIFGKSAEQIVGHNFVTFVYNYYEAETRDDFQELMQEAINNSRNNIATLEEIEVADDDTSEIRRLSIKVTPLDSTEFSSPTAIIDIRDLTSLRGFMENMQRADRLAAVGSLATGIAHEIRNPLGSIKGMTQLIEEDLLRNAAESDGSKSDDENSHHIDYLKRIRKETNRLDKLVGSIMDFARTEPGPVTTLNVNDLMRDVFEQAKGKTNIPEEKMPDIEMDFDEDLPDIPLEENRMRQAFLNLIINALEELAGQSNGKLLFRSFRDKSHRKRQLTFMITNTGNALPREIKEKIFEPFFTTKSEGTGLGLPIAYQIVVANNGALDFDYKDGMVVIKIRFPAKGVEENDIGSKTEVPGIVSGD